MRFVFDHANLNVTDLDNSIAFYREALGLETARVHEAADGSFKLAFLADAGGATRVELTWLRDKEGRYELGDNESHLCFVVDDFDAAWRFLEALGYSVVVHYEKYRTMYRLGDVLVTLDEMPYGAFMEIEGPSSVSIKTAAANLNLDWKRRIIESYLSIYYRLCGRLGRSPANLKAANRPTAPTGSGTHSPA